MPFVPYDEFFADEARLETRSLTHFEAGSPTRSYLFVESFCDEPGCDCRRVVFMVLSDQPGVPQPRARLTWGWEPEAFYRAWASFPLDEADMDELKGPGLMRLVGQSDEAPQLLVHLRTLLQSDAYRERIVRHYRKVREVVDARPTVEGGVGRTEPPMNRAERRRAKSGRVRGRERR